MRKGGGHRDCNSESEGRQSTMDAYGVNEPSGRLGANQKTCHGRSTHRARKCRLVSSGPLSQRIAKGCPRSATIASSTRVTLRLAKLASTSKAQTFPGVRVHHTQHRDRSPAVHRIVHKVQRPLLVRRSGCPTRIAVFPLSCAEYSARPRDTPDALACGSLALPFVAAERAAAPIP
jgi:hypothetical protein